MSQEAQFLYLTTTGHKSGRPHEIEIWFVAHAGCYYLVSEMRERSHWVQNIRKNASIRFRVEDRHYEGHGRVVIDADEPDLASAAKSLMDKKYGWSEGLLVELCAPKV